ncbi:MAG: hypothetical protein RIC55_27665 [Pirellulaceae bacterium]
MEESNSSEDNRVKPPEPAIEAGAEFLGALFAESDTILFRPIETWVEAGKKRSRVDYRNTCYRKAVPALLKVTLLQLLQTAESERLNLFFGVCPRGGNKGRFDLAWQIRTVRALWTDIDHVTVEEARERIVKAQLPQPSIIVNSGNGVHLYWLLDAPYQIDDAGDPVPVETEWTQTPDGRKKPRKYIVENGDKVYLDQRRHVSRLSPRAEHLQDVLAGIAKVVGGDHTTDLSRLLRIPGSFNRKDERSGREPVPTEMVECDPSRKYSLTVFEPLKSPSPETERAKQIASMPLPQARKISLSKADKLAELIAASGIAQAGCRSEADFAVCCYAIRNGIAKEEVWTQVEQVGKFAEQGQRYFDLTWDNAEFDARAVTFDKLQKRAAPKEQRIPIHAEDANGNGGTEAPADAEDGSNGGRPTIVVDSATMPVGDTLQQVTDQLLSTGNCFSRAEQLVVINDQQISPILSSPELAGLLNQHVEFYFVDDDAGEYKPFPPAYGNTWLHHHIQRGRLLVIKLFTHNPVYTDDWRLVAPGFDGPSGIYYAGPAIEARSGTEHLDALLRDFCFKSPADRTNYLGVLLTAMLVPRFIGSKPAALFNGNQPELGKSILAQIIAILRDGQSAETASYNPNDEEFEKRLGAIVRRGATTIIIDNAKGRGRNPRIESACLERSITDPILSFRLLGQSASIRAENSHIFCITANTPDVSRDLVTRSVVINLYFEGDPERREFSIADPEGYAHQHRLELLGELIGMVERWKASGMPMAKAHSRFNKRGWGNIVGGILDACGEPDFLANAEEAAALLDETRREFAELVGVLVEHPQGIWTAAELVELCGKHGLMAADLGDGSPRSLATKMGTLAGRFVSERFPLGDGREATFHRSDGRKGKVYQVYVQDEVPNLEGFAEPMPNLGNAAGSAR